MTNETESLFLKHMRENQGIIHKICHLYGKTETEKQDLFQEITIQLWRAYPTFRGGSKFSTWMYRVALNTAITQFRKKKKRQFETELKPEITNSLEYEQFDDVTGQRLRLLYKAIEHLNKVEKALVFLYLEDKPYREISATLGISEVNARVKMNRIKEKLRNIMT